MKLIYVCNCYKLKSLLIYIVYRVYLLHICAP